MEYGVKWKVTFVEGTGVGLEECRKPKDAGAAPVVLHTESKLKAEAGPQRGQWKLDKPGVVTLHLDNKHSVLRSKCVKYELNLVEDERFVEPVVAPRDAAGSAVAHEEKAAAP